MTESASQVIRRRRPLGVALISLFLLADAALTILEVLGFSPDLTARGPLLDASTMAPGLLLGLAALKVVAAVGLWLGSRRAWVLTMLLVGVSLLLDLYVYVVDEPRYLRLTIDVLIAFYLNQGLVREYFERRRDAEAEPVETPR